MFMRVVLYLLKNLAVMCWVIVGAPKMVAALARLAQSQKGELPKSVAAATGANAPQSPYYVGY